MRAIQDVEIAEPFNIITGQKICSRCRIPNNKFKEQEILNDNENNNDKEYSLPTELKRKEINNTVGSLIGLPMKSVSSLDMSMEELVQQTL